MPPKRRSMPKTPQGKMNKSFGGKTPKSAPPPKKSRMADDSESEEEEQQTLAKAPNTPHQNGKTPKGNQQQKQTPAQRGGKNTPKPQTPALSAKKNTPKPKTPAQQIVSAKKNAPKGSASKNATPAKAGKKIAKMEMDDEDDDDDSDDDDDDDSEGDSDEAVEKLMVGKDGEDDDDDSDDDDDDEDDDDDDDDSEDDDEPDEEIMKKVLSKLNKDEDSDDDDDDDDDDDEDDDDDDDSEEEVAAPKPGEKRKAGTAAVPVKEKVQKVVAPTQQKVKQEPAEKKRKAEAAVDTAAPEKRQKTDGRPANAVVIPMDVLKRQQKLLEERDQKTLFMSPLAMNTDPSDVKALSPAIKHVRLRHINSKSRPCLAAYVEFASKAAAEEHVKTLMGKSVKGQSVKVNYCGASHAKHKKFSDFPIKQEDFTGLKLFLSGLDRKDTNESLKKFFPQSLAVYLPGRREMKGGEHLGFAFVVYADPAIAKREMEANQNKPFLCVYGKERPKKENKKQAKNKKRKEKNAAKQKQTKKAAPAPQESDDDDDDEEEDDNDDDSDE